jgi:hypothetical protein
VVVVVAWQLVQPKFGCSVSTLEAKLVVCQVLLFGPLCLILMDKGGNQVVVVNGLLVDHFHFHFPSG